MTKPTKWHVRPAKTQISLGIRPVWSASSLSACRNLESWATHWAHREDSDQTRRMPRLIWVFAERTVHFVGFVTRRFNWHHVNQETIMEKVFSYFIIVQITFSAHLAPFCPAPLLPPPPTRRETRNCHADTDAVADADAHADANEIRTKINFSSSHDISWTGWQILTKFVWILTFGQDEELIRFWWPWPNVQGHCGT